MARGAPPAGAGTIHSTSSLCWSTPFRVEKKRRYRLAIVVTRPWLDGTIPATPEGFGIERMPWSVRYGAVLTRRSLMSRWFQPVLRIVRPNGAAHLQALEMRCACQAGAVPGGEPGRGVYTADFTAEASGELSFFVNDSVIGAWIGLPFGLTDWFYNNNRGEAELRLEEIGSGPDRTLPDPLSAPPP